MVHYSWMCCYDKYIQGVHWVTSKSKRIFLVEKKYLTELKINYVKFQNYAFLKIKTYSMEIKIHVWICVCFVNSQWIFCSHKLVLNASIKAFLYTKELIIFMRICTIKKNAYTHIFIFALSEVYVIITWYHKQLMYTQLKWTLIWPYLQQKSDNLALNIVPFWCVGADVAHLFHPK